MNEFDTVFYKIVGRKLRELRTENNLPINFLADKIGTTIKTVQRYEVGERKIDAGKLRTMVEGLGGDYEHFIASVQAEQSGHEKLAIEPDDGLSAEARALLAQCVDFSPAEWESLADYAELLALKRERSKEK